MMGYVDMKVLKRERMCGMRVSQLIHAMDRDDMIVIHDGNKKISNMCVYEGAVRGIKKDNYINRYFIHHIFADGDTIVVLAENQRMKGGAE
jgi:hypothetical protein